MKDKLVEQDIGMVDDVLELCKNLVSIESHSFGSYVADGNEKWLELSQKAREIRTKYLSMITKKDNSQGWCISKHIAECLMRIQEVYTRFLSTNQKEQAKICAIDYGNLYLLFMEINGYGGDENVSTKSSA